MSQIIDKRHNGRHKSAVNRRRFIERFKKQIRQSVATAVANRSMTDFEHGEKITIPNKKATSWHFLFATGLYLTISTQVFSQSFGWFAGFINYIFGMLLIFIYI